MCLESARRPAAGLIIQTCKEEREWKSSIPAPLFLLHTDIILSEFFPVFVVRIESVDRLRDIVGAFLLAVFLPFQK